MVFLWTFCVFLSLFLIFFSADHSCFLFSCSTSFSPPPTPPPPPPPPIIFSSSNNIQDQCLIITDIYELLSILYCLLWIDMLPLNWFVKLKHSPSPFSYSTPPFRSPLHTPPTPTPPPHLCTPPLLSSVASKCKCDCFPPEGMLCLCSRCCLWSRGRRLIRDLFPSLAQTMARQSALPLDASADLCPVLVSNLLNVSNSGVGVCACVREREWVCARVCVCVWWWVHTIA